MIKGGLTFSQTVIRMTFYIIAIFILVPLILKLFNRKK